MADYLIYEVLESGEAVNLRPTLPGSENTLKLESNQRLVKFDPDNFPIDMVTLSEGSYKKVVQYGTFGDQFDLLFHDIEDGKLGEKAKTSAWYLSIKAVKDANPKL